MTCFRIVGDLRRSLTAARPVLFPELLHLSRGGQLGQASVLGQVHQFGRPRADQVPRPLTEAGQL